MDEAVKSVLITGGSGLLGSAITDLLVQKGYQVSHLGRNPSVGKVKCFRWSIREKYIDPKSLLGVDVIIHLAGAGVAEKRWSEKRKKEILESRTQSGNLLFEMLRDTPNSVKVVLCASAIGYYGLKTSDEWCHEDNQAGADFLAGVTQAWEEATKGVVDLNKRLVHFRIGIVLSNMGGPLKEMAQPIRWGVGAPLGSGKQWVSWIHIDDLCQLFLFAMINENLKGVYNAVAPNPVTNRELTVVIARTLHRKLLVPPIPSFALKIILGQMAEIVVTGARASCNKIKLAGFNYTFADIGLAMKSLLG